MITEDTKLEADLSCYPGDAIVIGAPGITLDLNGHRVVSGHSGIRNDGNDDVVLRNGTVLADYEAVQLAGAERNRLQNLSLGGLFFSVTGTGANGTTVVGNRFTVSLRLGGDGIVVRDNHASSLYGDISLHGDGNVIADNSVSGTDAASIAVSGERNRIVRNTITDTITEGGIRLFDASDNVVAHNSIAGWHPDGFCSLYGVQLQEASRNLVRDNSVAYQRTGLALRSGDANVFLRNRVSHGECPGVVGTRTDHDGLRVDAAATRTVLWGNVASNMNDDGIDVDAPGTALRGNVARQNGDLGIEAVPGVIDLGGNRASGNGNPLQCLGVVCG